MKYFINELDEDTWLKNRDAYWKLFDTICMDLPKRVAKIFTSKYLHDSEIDSITCVREDFKRKSQYNIIIKITNEEFSGELVHYNVSDFQVKAKFGEYMYMTEYLYGEILKEDSDWTHNFLLRNSDEIFIKCKKIDWFKQK